jgi:hypothetical protein
LPYWMDGSPVPVTLNTTMSVWLSMVGAAGVVAAGAGVVGAVVGAPLGVPVATSSVTCVQVAGPQMSLIALRSGTITAEQMSRKKYCPVWSRHGLPSSLGRSKHHVLTRADERAAAPRIGAVASGVTGLVAENHRVVLCLRQVQGPA